MARRFSRSNRRVRPRRSWRLPWRGLAAAAIALGLVGGLTAGARWALDPHTLPVRIVQIRGDLAHVTENQLRDTLRPLVSSSFFLVKPAAIQKAVTGLAWVEAASVRRVWPDAVEVALRERTAEARWGDGALVSLGGEVFSPPLESFPPGLPLWHGPPGTHRLLADRYRRMQPLVVTVGLRIVELELDARGAWRVRLDNGLDLALGRRQEMERLARFVRVYPSGVEAWVQAIEQVDMRYSNGFAVRWRELDGAGGTAPLGAA